VTILSSFDCLFKESLLKREDVGWQKKQGEMKRGKCGEISESHNSRNAGDIVTGSQEERN